MITNGGNNEGLFRGAVMQSGGPIPVGNIEHGQEYYDSMVERTGCGDHKDTLECLRKVPYTTFKKAMDESPNMFAYQVGAYIVPLWRVWRLHHFTGTDTGLVAPSRWRLPEGATSSFRPTWPRSQRIADYRCVSLSHSLWVLRYFSGNCDDEGTVFAISSSNVRQV